MNYAGRSLREMKLDLDRAGEMPVGYKAPDGLPGYLPVYISENIFSNTDPDDPVFSEASDDFLAGYNMLNTQFLDDGLSPLDLPEGVRAEDLGESMGVVPTKYGGFAFIPMGTTKAFYDPENDEIVLNRRIIYGTREHKESAGLYRKAMEFLEKHAPEWVKDKLEPFYRDRLGVLEDRDKSREQLMETSAHETVHKKQNETGLLRKYMRNITDNVRDMIERHCIRYTSRIFRKRTADAGTSYAYLEDEAIDSERRKSEGPEGVFRRAESFGPDRGSDWLEYVYARAS